MSKVSSILSAFHALAIAITLASCEKVAIPYVLRYLTNELAAMNIKLSFELKEKGNFE